MIRITNDNDRVVLTVDTTIGWKYEPSWRASGGEDHAFFVADSMKKHLFNKLVEIRREAYEEGWKDAKKKTAKKTWFKGWF